MEKQRSRVDWLKDVDRYTSLFQAKSRTRAQLNKISSLKRADGLVVVKQNELEEVAMDFYGQLFAAQDEPEPNLILEHVSRKITEEMNNQLVRPYSLDEVERALHVMGASKAPGLDGFTTGFYQLHWDLVGNDIAAAVLDFLNGGVMLEDLNHTTIVLIPKTRNPQEMK